MTKRQKIDLSTVVVLVVGLLFVGLVWGLLPQPRVQAQSDDLCASDVFVQPGETLSIIAGRTLGNLASYNLIVDATNAKAAVDPSYATIDNPNILTLGWKLCVPHGSGLPAGIAAGMPKEPTATPVPTPIFAPTPPALDLTLDKMNPLMIEYMRQQSYLGSDIVLEETFGGQQNLCIANRAHW